MFPYYQDNFCTIYHGDCREVLQELKRPINEDELPPMSDAQYKAWFETSYVQNNFGVRVGPLLGKIDLILTDPPYGVTKQSWDITDSVMSIIKSAELAVFTTGERLLAELICALPNQFRHVWIWDRVNKFTDFLNASRRPMRAHELIAVFSQKPKYQFTPIKRKGFHLMRNKRTSSGNGTYGQFGPAPNYGKEKTELHPTSIIAIKGANSNYNVHPTEKPIALFRYLLESYPADVTLDPYMGSGTTLCAAKELGRKAIGIELEEKYCEIAAKRLAQEVLFL